MAFTSPGAKSRQDGETDRACKSPILLREVMAVRKTIFRVRNLTGADSSGSKGVLTKPSSTIARSQEGTVALVGGLNRLAPRMKRATRGCLPIETPSIRAWQAEIAATKTLSVPGLVPEDSLSCRNSNTETIWQ